MGPNKTIDIILASQVHIKAPQFYFCVVTPFPTLASVEHPRLIYQSGDKEA